MSDPISGSIDLAFFFGAMVVFILLAIAPRRALKLLFSNASLPKQAVVLSMQMLAGFCAAAIAATLAQHLIRSHEWVAGGPPMFLPYPSPIVCQVPLSVAIPALKQQASRKFERPGDIRFWQRRHYDFHVWNHGKTVEIA